MDILLIAGLWLDGSAWDAVVPHLRELGHRAVPLWLPGQGAPPAAATLADQHAAVLAAVDAAAGKVVVVGHSAAGTLAWMAADARPEQVARVVMIGGFTSSDGKAYADFFELEDGVMPFPGWEPFDGPDSADLDDEKRQRIASAAIAVPEAVARGIVRLRDERRFEVPVTLICPEFSPAEARGWIDGGEVPELAKARHVDYVDIESGHWPMFTRPAELAGLLAAAADAADAVDAVDAADAADA
ncbi:MAG TPA: alpha/beta hydrolase [Streptosporangiaceae bacterium]|nr:alpha/beta hydrolase [Streptosporangiaceae bacterium]